METSQLAIWTVILAEGSPLIAALVVSVILARSGFREKMSEYRQDTLMLVQMRAETVEKQLADSRLEIQELLTEAQQREALIRDLEEERTGGALYRPHQHHHSEGQA